MPHAVAAHVAALVRRTWPDPVQRRQANTVFAAAVALAVAGVVAIPAAGHRHEQRALRAVASPVLAERAEAAPTVSPAAPPAAPAAPPAPAVPAPPPPAPPADTAVLDPARLPAGKGMWLWLPERSDGGDPVAIVNRAKAVGLSHLFVRTGSSWMGFYAQDFLDRLLPVAHANGIRVYGWDFPNFKDWKADAERAIAAITYTTPDGHRIDGFSADVETPSEGVRLSPEAALAYGTYLRQGVGHGYPLIACVPRMTDLTRTRYPYPHVVAQFDAIAPMVYWMHRDPAADLSATMDYLARFGKPLMPVGQAYDGGPEGGPPGNPPASAIHAFMGTAAAKGARAVSFWSWQAASPENWDAIRDAVPFRLPPLLPVLPVNLPPIVPLPR